MTILSSKYLDRHGPTHAPARARAMGALAAAAVLVGLAGCQEVIAPVPIPLPSNIDIVVQPAYAASVDAATTHSFSLDFSRSMDPTSLRSVRSVSFLLPITVDQLEGRWEPGNRHLVFDLTQFPVQRGATYQVVFTGLRTADGELYNMGPYKVLFRTRGEPDLLPMRPLERVSRRVFCHREGSSDDPCAYEAIHSAWSSGTDSLTLETRCDDCGQPARRDLFRRAGNRIVWVGFDVEPGAGAPARTVRWPQPPPLLALPSVTRQSLTGADQVASDGTELQQWSCKDAGKDSPIYVFVTGGLPIHVSFDDSRTIAVEYTLRVAGRLEHHRERWWLYPGVGLVRRETHLDQDGDPATVYRLETYTPSIADLLPN